jgi:hypothetical protein
MPADVVGDRRGVARVVLGDALLDLADEVGADVGGLGEDAAADTHEHGEQRRTEAEALEHRRRLLLVDEDDGRRTKEAEADGEHACDAAGAERDAHGRVLARVVGRSCDADVAADREPHAHVAGDAGEHGTDDEEDRSTDPLRRRVGGQQEEEEEDQGREHGQGAELAAEVRRSALLHRARDLLHLVGALARGEDLTDENQRDAEGEHRDERDDGHQRVVPARDGHAADGSDQRPGHAVSLNRGGGPPPAHRSREGRRRTLGAPESTHACDLGHAPPGAG